MACSKCGKKNQSIVKRRTIKQGGGTVPTSVAKKGRQRTSGGQRVVVLNGKVYKLTS